MLFFRIREYPLNCFFSQCVQSFVFFGVPEVIHFFYVIGPNVSTNSFGEIFAIRTLQQQRAVSARSGIRAVYPVPFSGCCLIG
jgi:hypothetical protein